MRGHEFLDKMGLIRPEYVEAADVSVKRKANIFAVAACICLIAVAAFAVVTLRNDLPQNTGDDITASDTQEEPSIDTDEVVIPPENTQKPVQEGLYVPPVKLPESETSADMIGLVVYQGNIYIQSSGYIFEDALTVKPLLGEYLGFATGSITEWSDDSEYEQNFASTIRGAVYAVEGYDTEFRVAMKSEMRRENGEKYLWIQFYDHLNGIYINTGDELFEDRLHMRERIETIEYQAGVVMDFDLRTAEFSEGTWDAFVDELYRNEFVYTWTGEEPFYEDEPHSSIYTSPNRVLLKLTMDDSTEIYLDLIEGGYVGLSGFGWYFVKMPGEAFDAVYSACGGTHLPVSEWW